MTTQRESFLTVMEYRRRIESGLAGFFRNDPALAACRPLPHPRKPNKIIFFSGAMAVFFPLASPAGTTGVKLFFQKIPDLAVRYEAIAGTLARLQSPWFIQLEYREGPRRGAVWGVEHTPYVKMECVEGVVLKERVDELARRGDRQALRGLAEQWREIALAMEREGIAHGDIQAENLMVESSGRIRLIDLDTMFVPSLRTRGFGCVAYGIPAWQHPLKTTDPGCFDERLDRFPALAMYLSLLALAEDPTLYDPTAVGENEILFSKDDFRQPAGSAVLQRLDQSSDPEVRRLASLLASTAAAPYDLVPPFSRASDPDAEAADSLAAFQAEFAAGEHERATRLWSARLEGYPPAEVARADYAAAMAHLEKLHQFLRALPGDDDFELAGIWEAPPALDHCACGRRPIQPSGGGTVRSRGELATRRVAGLRALEHAIEVADRERAETGFFREISENALTLLWGDGRQDLTGCRLARERVGERVEAARRRADLWLGFDRLLAGGDDFQIAETWRALADFGPAQARLAEAADATGRAELLAAFLAQLRKDPLDDAALWAIWAGRADMGSCRPASRPHPDFGGLIPAQRAALARDRVAALAEVESLRAALGQPPLDEAGERALIAGWRKHEAVLAACAAARPVRRRVEEAQRRLQAWETLRQGMDAADDEPIARAWNSSLLGQFSPAMPLAEAAARSVGRMAVIAALNARHAQNPEDEAGFASAIRGTEDMEHCRAFCRPEPFLGGVSWRDRLQRAERLLAIKAALAGALAGDPPRFDQVAGTWDEALCGRHSLFAADLGRIRHALALAGDLERLRQGLAEDRPELIAGAWREEFRNCLVAGEAPRIRAALLAHFNAANCLEALELELEGETLTVRWHWKGTLGFCLVAAGDGAFPAPPGSPRPNAFRGGAGAGLCTLAFSGHSPHVRIWGMFRFLDELLLAREPLERRLLTVEYACDHKPWRGCQLSIRSLSGPVELPALGLYLSENPLWPGKEPFQNLPPRHIDSVAARVDLVLPRGIERGRTLYLGLRAGDRSVDDWLRVRPRDVAATRVRF